ncbi:MAG: hypothetical protein ACOYBC_03675 [Bilifractor sp.]|jgi:hypothetical protein
MSDIYKNPETKTEEIVKEDAADNEEIFEDVEEAVTASWTGCANCCH